MFRPRRSLRGRPRWPGRGATAADRPAARRSVPRRRHAGRQPRVRVRPWPGRRRRVGGGHRRRRGPRRSGDGKVRRTMDLVFAAPRRAMPPRHLADLDDAGRIAAVTELGLPAFRANQLANQYYGRLIADPREMTDLPAAVRERVADAIFPTLLTPERQIECDAGQTRKTLWRAIDGTTFESVLMRYPQRNTVCISSQAGCGMACPFCATGQAGLTRNLSTAEIVEQVRAAAVALRDDCGDRLSNVVFMGMGEPLANYARVLAAVRGITGGFGISARSVTVSTVG